MQIRSNYLHESETVLDSALRIARFEALAQGGYRLLDDALAIYEDIGAQEIKKVVKRFFADEAWSIVCSVPEDAGKR